jgi:hypothetical protein
MIGACDVKNEGMAFLPAQSNCFRGSPEDKSPMYNSSPNSNKMSQLAHEEFFRSAPEKVTNLRNSKESVKIATDRYVLYFFFRGYQLIITTLFQFVSFYSRTDGSRFMPHLMPNDWFSSNDLYNSNGHWYSPLNLDDESKM